MVTSGAPTPNNGDAYYERLQEAWPSERPSARRQRRAYSRKTRRQVVIRAERLEQPDPVRMSRALIAAQRELVAAQAETAARDQARLDAAEDTGPAALEES